MHKKHIKGAGSIPIIHKSVLAFYSAEKINKYSIGNLVIVTYCKASKHVFCGYFVQSYVNLILPLEIRFFFTVDRNIQM